jgi:hypothetical protein
MSTHTQATATTVRCAIVVDTPIERAFRVFTAESPERTRVELEHRNLDRHGAGWEDERDAVGGGGGWPLYLRRFAAAADEQT